MNYKLLIQYDGTEFHGWQIQNGLRTVQGELTRALSLIEGRDVVLHGSGRTDAGVHAEGQAANVMLEREITCEKLRSAINGNVAKDVRVLDVSAVDDRFHARYSAVGKTYLYRILNGPVLTPFWLRYALQEARDLDLNLIQSCSKLFLGQHEWTAFSAAQTDAESRVRTVRKLCVNERFDERGRSRMLEITANADGFLRYMVRSIVGTLLAVGRGELSAEEVQKAIANGDRSLVGPTAPAHGLTLVSVDY